MQSTCIFGIESLLINKRYVYDGLKDKFITEKNTNITFLGVCINIEPQFVVLQTKF